MKKGFGLGWILLGAALLTPYATEKNEETGECEARSLLLKVKTKNTVEEDGSKHFDYKLNFAGIPTAATHINAQIICLFISRLFLNCGGKNKRFISGLDKA